ncbi:hypothetical protein TNCV_2859531 [Trichonephila clavipes]|nr:hypothetical protein TNCV_2859531 [Trichonephila clavipes]
MATLLDCPVRWLTYGNPKTVRKLGEQVNKAVLGWVMKGLIPSKYECQCKKDMLLVERKGTIDGFEWRCRVQSKENPHFVCRSVRKVEGSEYTQPIRRNVLINSTDNFDLGQCYKEQLAGGAFDNIWRVHIRLERCIHIQLNLPNSGLKPIMLGF